MNFKKTIKKFLPKQLHTLYNRIFSKHIIRKRIGEWFDVDWKAKAFSADDTIWLETYEEAWKHQPEQDLSHIDIDKIKSKVNTAEYSILDAGCGDGFLLEALSGNCHAMTGVDISMKALELARRRLGAKALFAQAFLEKLPFKNDAFDIVVTAHTLEHVKDLHKAVSELIRVARKRLVVLVPSQEYVRYSMDYHIHYFPHEDDLLNAIGLSQALCERYSIPPGLCAYQGDILLLTAELH